MPGFILASGGKLSRTRGRVENWESRRQNNKQMKVTLKIRMPAVLALALTALFSEQKVVAAAPVPVKIYVVMSDGSTATIPLGTWLTFQNNTLRVVFPLQYVNQVANRQADNTWKYNKPGRNLQVWKNGILMREQVGAVKGDYTVSMATMTITPTPVVLDDGTVIPTWPADATVTVAYIY